MSYKEDKPVALAYVDELAAQAQTPEDKAIVENWRNEVEAERAEALQSMSTKREAIVSVAGTTATAQEIQNMREAGQELSGPLPHGHAN